MQMSQNQAIRYLKAMDDTDPTTVNIGTATQLWGSEILCNLQQYMNKYIQQYISAQAGMVCCATVRECGDRLQGV